MSALLDLKEKIRTEALRLGFNHMGVAPAVPVQDYQHYQTWIEQGYHGKMGYLAREDAVQKRGNPELILENCQRIISLAMPYRPPQKTTTSSHRVPGGFQPMPGQTIITTRFGKNSISLTVHSSKQRPARAAQGLLWTLAQFWNAVCSDGRLGNRKNTCLIVPGTGPTSSLLKC